MSEATAVKFQRFREFYPFYLTEHSNRTCRRLHFAGSTLALVFLATAIVEANGWWLVGMPLAGYAFARIGHYGFEKNQPASFKQPLFSLMGDWVMYKDILTGRIPF